MIKSRLGAGMVSSDKDILDKLLQEAVSVTGNDYASVLEYVIAYILEGDYPSSLKSHALRTSSWLKKYVYEYVQVH